MEVQGTLKMIGDVQQITDNFAKREFVVTTDEQYPQHLLIEVVNDKCDLLNHFAEGERVKVGINLRGREWTNNDGVVKYFNSIQGWKMDAIKSDGSAENAAREAQDGISLEEEEDDLPF